MAATPRQRPRPYEALLASLRPGGDSTAAMTRFVDAAWDSLSGLGVSWIGFYLPAGDQELVLGPRRDKPACSPIGMHGACGRCFLERRPLIIGDVARLGPNYIACDPRDRSELVLPLLDAMGRCVGVLDVDSHELEAFELEDAERLNDGLLLSAISHYHFRAADVLRI